MSIESAQFLLFATSTHSKIFFRINNTLFKALIFGDGISSLFAQLEFFLCAIIKLFTKNILINDEYFLIIEYNMVPTLLVKVCYALIYRCRFIINAPVCLRFLNI